MDEVIPCPGCGRGLTEMRVGPDEYAYDCGWCGWEQPDGSERLTVGYILTQDSWRSDSVDVARLLRWAVLMLAPLLREEAESSTAGRLTLAQRRALEEWAPAMHEDIEQALGGVMLTEATVEAWSSPGARLLAEVLDVIADAQLEAAGRRRAPSWGER